MSIRIRAKNFRSFVDLDWEIPDGLTLIDGENRDTGGSNEAGKSTLLESWLWARYGWLPKWGSPKGGPLDGVIRRGEKACSVQINEKLGSDEIEILRERPHKISVKKNGQEVPSGQKSIDQLLGMPAERALVCSYIPQRKRRSFFFLSDAERTELFSAISGLESLDAALERARRLESAAEIEVAKSEGLKGHLEKLAGELPNLVSHAWKVVGEKERAIEEFILAVKSARDQKNLIVTQATAARDRALDEEVGKIREIMTRVREEKAEIIGKKNRLLQSVSEKKALDPALVLRRDAAKAALDAAMRKNFEIDRRKALNLDILAQAEKEQKRANEAKEGKCGHCGQLLPGETRQKAVDKHLFEALSQMKRVYEIEAEIDVAPLSSELALAQEDLTKASQEIESGPARVKSEVISLELAISSKVLEERALDSLLLTTESQIQDKFTRAVFSADQAVSQTESALRLVEAEVVGAKKLWQEKKDAQVRAAEELEKVLVIYRAALSKLDEARDLVDLFGPKGYRTVCFDDLIARVSDRAGQLVSAMTDGLRTTRLIQFKEDVKGQAKIVLRPVVTKGSQEVLVDDLSGGAEDRFALAYDIALSDVAGGGLPLIVDEAFPYVDSVGMVEVMRLLEEAARSRPVLVVDHKSEFKAMFSRVIRVIYEKGESRLEAP